MNKKYTKKEIIKKMTNIGLKSIYFPKDIIFGKQINISNGYLDFQVNYTKDGIFESIQLNAFLNDITTTNIEIVQKHYDEFINKINEIKKVHIELLESIKSDK